MAIKGSTYIMSEEQKEAIRQSRLGYKPTLETCRRISNALKGHKVNSLTRIHIARARRSGRNEISDHTGY